MNTEWLEEWLKSQEVTMSYECIGVLPCGSVFQVRKQVVCKNQKDADDKITEWNRLATITKVIKWSYRRLS